MVQLLRESSKRFGTQPTAIVSSIGNVRSLQVWSKTAATSYKH
jgi:hypothetical protein